MKKLIICAAAIALVTQPALADSFNLRCTGTQTYGGFSKVDEWTKNGQPAVNILRVDLDARRWCIATCEKTSPIAIVTETEIFFESKESDLSDEVVRVHRETGEYLNRHRNRFAKFVMMTYGKCEREPFSGFPARKF